MYHHPIGLSLLCAALIGVTCGTKLYCEIPIASKQYYRHQWPLVFGQVEGELLPTTSSTFTTTADGESKQLTVVRVPAGIEVVLSCAPNYLKHYQRLSNLTVRCNGDNGNFTVLHGNAADKTSASEELSALELTCDLRAVESIVMPVTGCNNAQWTATHFGYVRPQTTEALVLGESCYDTQLGRTRFAHLRLGAPGYLLRASRTYFTGKTHPDSRYKIEFFRNLHFDEIYARLRSTLELKHVPDLQLTQYVDETLLPSAQLQAVKKLAWNYFVAYDHLEALDPLKLDIKQLAQTEPIDLYVGSHGVKTLLSATGVVTPIYVQQDSETQRFPVPAHIWIIVQTIDKHRGIAFVVANSYSNASVALTATPLCPSECGSVTWLKHTSASMPGLLCCSVTVAQRVIEEIPAEITVPSPAMWL